MRRRHAKFAALGDVPYARSGMSRWLFATSLATACFVGAPDAHAQRDLDERQPTAWTVGHLVVSGALLGVAAGFQFLSPDDLQPNFRGGLWFERDVDRNFSRLSAGVSDFTLAANIVLPPVVLATAAPATSVENALVIYTETNAATLALTLVTKFAVRRARPYVPNPDPETAKAERESGADRAFSFFSGHAAVSFASTTSGGYLLSALGAPEEGRAVYWASAMSLSAFTSHLRIRAGMHYPSDVVVGAVVGTGLGFLVPALHGVPFEMTGVEGAALGGGLVLGACMALVMPTETADEFARHPLSIAPTSGGAVLSWGREWD